jgi:hypothetical protein
MLARGPLRSGPAKLQWFIALFATTGDESDNGAKHCHNCDFFGVHGSTPSPFPLYERVN